MLVMDSGTFPKKLFASNIRIPVVVALPILLGNSPWNLFWDRERTIKFWESKRRGGREPVSLLSDKISCSTSISASHCGNIPSSWFLLKSRVWRVFCLEIQYGIFLTRPQEFKDNSDSINFGIIFALLFQVRWLPPKRRLFKPLILNNQDGVSPMSKLFSNESASNFVKFCMDDGIVPLKLL